MPGLRIADVRAAIANSRARWEAGPNPISKLPWDEQLHRLGVQPPSGLSLDQLATQFRSQRSAQTAPALPQTLDYRNITGANYVTQIRDQVNCGTLCRIRDNSYC
jgi:hypothetical protein